MAYKIVLIGAGNLATHLGVALKKAGHKMVQVVSIHPTSAEVLANKLKCTFTTYPEKIILTADVYLIAVTDSAISKVAKQLRVENKIVIHTSGSTDIKVLQPASDNYGVLYPLQTFSKKREIDFSKVPLLLEASNPKTGKVLENIATSITFDEPYYTNSEERMKVHLAAVFVNNFTNHLYGIARDIIAKDGFDMDMFQPLMMETIAKIANKSPNNMQTGPAARGDIKTMKTHIKLLEGNPDYQKIYKQLSKSIIESAKKNKL